MASQEGPDLKKARLFAKASEELLLSERSYVGNLSTFNDFLKSKDVSDILNEKLPEYKLFSQIFNINNSLLTDMEKSRDTPEKALKNFVKYFLVYGDYIKAHDKITKKFGEFRKNNKKFDKLCDEFTNQSGTTVESCLILPVQRVPRYKLLLTEMLKLCKASDERHQNIEKCLEEVEIVANSLNTRMAQQQDLPKINEFFNELRKKKSTDPIVRFWEGFEKSGRVLPYGILRSIWTLSTGNYSKEKMNLLRNYLESTQFNQTPPVPGLTREQTRMNALVKKLDEIAKADPNIENAKNYKKYVKEVTPKVQINGISADFSLRKFFSHLAKNQRERKDLQGFSFVMNTDKNQIILKDSNGHELASIKMEQNFLTGVQTMKIKLINDKNRLATDLNTTKVLQIMQDVVTVYQRNNVNRKNSSQTYQVTCLDPKKMPKELVEMQAALRANHADLRNPKAQAQKEATQPQQIPLSVSKSQAKPPAPITPKPNVSIDVIRARVNSIPPVKDSPARVSPEKASITKVSPGIAAKQAAFLSNAAKTQPIAPTLSKGKPPVPPRSQNGYLPGQADKIKSLQSPTQPKELPPRPPKPSRPYRSS